MHSSDVPPCVPLRAGLAWLPQEVVGRVLCPFLGNDLCRLTCVVCACTSPGKD